MRIYILGERKVRLLEYVSVSINRSSYFPRKLWIDNNRGRFAEVDLGSGK